VEIREEVTYQGPEELTELATNDEVREMINNKE
jgi:hypothetical protein